MRKLLTLIFCNVFIVAMLFGSILLGQPTPAFASRAIAPHSAVSSVQSLNSTDGWLIAQTSGTEVVSEEALEDLPQGATLAEEALAPGGCTAEGFFPHPTDCKKFRRCVFDPRFNSFTEYVFDCAPGTDLWCQEIQTCSFAFQCPGTCGN